MCAGAARLAAVVFGQAEDLARYVDILTRYVDILTHKEEGLAVLLLLCLLVVVHKLMYYVCLADAQLLADLLDSVGILPSDPECPVYQIKAFAFSTGSGPRASP